MRAENIRHLAQVVTGYVEPVVARFGLDPIHVQLRYADHADDAEAVLGALDANGVGEPVELPRHLVSVLLGPAEWIRVFGPIRAAARQEVRRVVDVCDPAASPYAMAYPARWTATRLDLYPGPQPVAGFRAVDGARPEVLWHTWSERCSTYAALADWAGVGKVVRPDHISL